MKNKTTNTTDAGKCESLMRTDESGICAASEEQLSGPAAEQRSAEKWETTYCIDQAIYREVIDNISCELFNEAKELNVLLYWWV